MYISQKPHSTHQLHAINYTYGRCLWVRWDFDFRCVFVCERRAYCGVLHFWIEDLCLYRSILLYGCVLCNWFKRLVVGLETMCGFKINLRIYYILYTSILIIICFYRTYTKYRVMCNSDKLTTFIFWCNVWIFPFLTLWYTVGYRWQICPYIF